MKEFPLVEQDFYERAKDSRLLDESLGFRIEEIEGELLERARKDRPTGHLWSLGQGIHQGNQTWVGLDPQTLQTPYTELIEMLEIVKPRGNESIIDLGAGYGRLGIVTSQLYPQMKFIGLEYVRERVQHGNYIFHQLGINGQLIEQDLTADDFILPYAELYFLYDFGELPHIRKILNQLGEKKHPFKLIARGKGTQGLVDHEHRWLSDVHRKVRRPNFTVYGNFDW